MAQDSEEQRELDDAVAQLQMLAAEVWTDEDEDAVMRNVWFRRSGGGALTLSGEL